MTTPSIYLLSTAALPPALVEEAVMKGILLDTMNFIATEPVADEVLGARISELGRQRLTAVFTSINAVGAVKGWMNAGVAAAVGGNEAGVPDWRIFCIGGTTRRAVADHFGEAAIAGTAESATELAKVVMANAGERDREIFFFCGDQRREELPAMLRGEGFTVNEWIVYRTRLTPQKVQRVYSGIAFFSPSAVESYFSLHTAANDVILFAIGRTTAAAIQARCSHPVIIGDRPEKDALIRTMIDHFQTNNKE